MGRLRTKDLDLPARMYRKGNSYYFVNNTPPRKWIPLGRDLERAKRRMAQLQAGPSAQLSVADVVYRYIDREERAPKTQVQYRSICRAIAEHFPMPAEQLDSEKVMLWCEQNAHRRSHVQSCLKLLTPAFRFGHELGLCKIIKVDGWKAAGRVRDLTPTEFRAIRSQAIEWLQVAMDLAYLTGAAPSDIRTLRWDQVTDDRIAMKQEGKRVRMVLAISEDLASVLKQARQRSILGLYVVGTVKGQPVSAFKMQTAWHAACAAAGVTDAQFRDIKLVAAKAERDHMLREIVVARTVRKRL